jgi:hypothetical protein
MQVPATTHDFHASLLPQLRREPGFLEAQEVLPFSGLFIGGAVCARTPSVLASVAALLAANGDPPPQLLAHPLSAVRRTLCLPLDDHTDEDLFPVLRPAVDFIAAERLAMQYGDASVPGYAGRVDGDGGSRRGSSSGGGGVLVHCTLGISRSAAICCAYVMFAGRERLDAALGIVRRARKWARPNDGFLEQLAHYEVLLGLAGPGRPLHLGVGAAPADDAADDAAAHLAESARRALGLSRERSSQWPSTLEEVWSDAPDGKRPRIAWVTKKKEGARAAAPLGPAAAAAAAAADDASSSSSPFPFPFAPSCELCRLARTTPWHGSPVAAHPAFVILDCDQCDAGLPMAVLRWHVPSWEGGRGDEGPTMGSGAAAAAAGATRQIRADMEAALLAVARARGPAAASAPSSLALPAKPGGRWGWVWRVDALQRSVPDHAHAHARPVAVLEGSGAATDLLLRSRL